MLSDSSRVKAFVKQNTAINYRAVIPKAEIWDALCTTCLWEAKEREV